MSLQQWLALAAMASLPFAALAQQEQSEYSSADPSAPVGAARYDSVFKSYRASGNEDQSPDRIWRSANDEMEKLGGHAGHIKADAGQEDALPVGRAAEQSPQRESDQSAPARSPAAPADHSQHH